MTHPFRFGLEVATPRPAAAWRELARQAEDRGFSTFQLTDHLAGQFAPVPALMAAAAATSTLRIGTIVLNNDLRHPVVLARKLPPSTCCRTAASSSASGPGGCATTTRTRVFASTELTYESNASKNPS